MKRSIRARAVSYEAVGSGEGIRRFIGRNVSDHERVDFGASDAAMTDAEMAAVDRGALLLPATAGGVVLAYNVPGFDGELKLSRDAYARIFLGEIKMWNDPAIAKTNPGVRLPRLSIATVVRQDGSGTTFAFTNHLRSISQNMARLATVQPRTSTGRATPCGLSGTKASPAG